MTDKELRALKAVMAALAGEPPRVVSWALQVYDPKDILAAKQLADESNLDFEDVLLFTAP